MDPTARARRAAEHRERWSAAHGGVVPASWLVRVWLDLVRSAAEPLARAGVRPDALTLGSLALALAALLPAAAGGRWAVTVSVLLAVSAVGDGLDGAVAVLTGTGSRRGAVLDAVCDRVADAAGLAVLWLLGAPAALAVAAGALGWLAEYVRARAQGEGMPGPGVVSVNERPTRVAIAAAFALGCGCYPSHAAQWAGVGTLAAVVLAAAGLVQVVVAVSRQLGATPGR